MKKLILASKSPRREELLKMITDNFEIIVSEVEEILPDGIDPKEAPLFLAALKAQAVAREHKGETVIGADTVVISDGIILGKPKDEDDAFSMLSALSGKTHFVVTGCCITDGKRELSFSECTEVTFYDLSDDEIRAYIRTGEPMDKAGAYGIQEKASVFVREIRGDFFNVVGLPVAKLYRNLREFEEMEK